MFMIKTGGMELSLIELVGFIYVIHIYDNNTVETNEPEPEMIVPGSVVITVKPGVQQSTRLELQSLQPFSKFTVRFEYINECSIEGGNPTPEITWILRDQLGHTKEMTGEAFQGCCLRRDLLMLVH